MYHLIISNIHSCPARNVSLAFQEQLQHLRLPRSCCFRQGGDPLCSCVHGQPWRGWRDGAQGVEPKEGKLATQNNSKTTSTSDLYTSQS